MRAEKVYQEKIREREALKREVEEEKRKRKKKKDH